ncbi:hypothetical protein SDC9_194834 [bioreactor metagenome]|uniref:Uncharacterized protein n=1 Tax=bioreactor metagenome TaxID=1076179 RepID=A0A645IIQ6_9ZZZZ|nr:hypothetical protein [Proteiniphilum sp.]
MFDFIKFLFFSENKAVYRAIARENHVGAFRVYRLAHGKRARTNKDYQILKRLRREEIIEGVLQMG